MDIKKRFPGAKTVFIGPCVSKKDEGEWKGRSSQNKTVVFPAQNVKLGDFVKVKIVSSSSATLRGEIVK